MSMYGEREPARAWTRYCETVGNKFKLLDAFSERVELQI